MGRLSGSFNAILVGTAVMAGWWLYGWKGLVLALSMIVFWMILQFNRATRLVAKAAKHPKGHLSESVVMVQASLSPGMTLGEVIAITGSLGIKVSEHRDDWRWTDSGGDDIVVSLRRGVVVRWAITRSDEASTAADPVPLEMPSEAPLQPK